MDKGLACSLLMYLQALLGEAGRQFNVLLSILVEHLDHKNVVCETLTANRRGNLLRRYLQLTGESIGGKGFSGTRRYFGDLGKLRIAGSNVLFAAVTEISYSILRGSETSGFDGMIAHYLEQRCYKDLQNENYGSVKAVLHIHRKLLSNVIVCW